MKPLLPLYKTGSPWVILSRSFIEHVVYAWDNLPRKLLMYFANVAYSVESYFQTAICNSPQFINTTVNDDLRYFVWDDPPGLDPLFLNESNYEAMINSKAAFARRFIGGDEVLNKVDDQILRRSSNGVSYGKWCLGREEDISETGSEDLCLTWGDINLIEPRPEGKELRELVAKIIERRGCV